MATCFAVVVAGLIMWPAPGYAMRDEANGIEKQIAGEVLVHAQMLRQSFNDGNTNNNFSTGRQLQLTQNQFFATCGLSAPAVRTLAGDELQLRAVGKLAQSGTFFASSDSHWLVKAVSLDEMSKLTELGKIKLSQTEYSDCHGFHKSLLLPIPLAFFGFNKRAYLVMQNETERLTKRAQPEWQVAQLFDIKPLPNLAGQLAELVSTLSTGWLASFEPLSNWDGWDNVSNALQHDCQLLTLYKVVDFSLFIHVLQRTSPTHESSSNVSALDGCIAEPSRAAVVCFAILDYLLGFGSSRKLESSWKSHKFQDYGDKLMHAFACIGDLNSKGCEAYHDYSTIRAGTTNSKVALLGSQTFARNYVCQVERPKLQYKHKFLVVDTSMTIATEADEPIEWTQSGDGRYWSEEVSALLPEVLHGANWSYDGSGYNANVAGWLQEAVSSDKSGHVNVIASGYEQRLEQGLEQPEKGFQLHNQELAACKQGIEEFSTSSWKGQSNHKDLGNIIWSPRLNSVFVVRGKNTLYSNSKVVTEMRKKHCFMLVRFFRCRARDGKRTIFDYKTSFGSLEILQVMPSASSGTDFKVFRTTPA